MSQKHTADLIVSNNFILQTMIDQHSLDHSTNNMFIEYVLYIRQKHGQKQIYLQYFKSLTLLK